MHSAKLQTDAGLTTWARLVTFATWLYGLGCFAILCVALPWSAGLSARLVLVVGTALLLLAIGVGRLAPLELPAPSRVTLSLVLIVALGLVLRIGWVALVAPVQMSDMSDYVVSARDLLAGHGYFSRLWQHKLLAFRPPGESFLLAGAMWLIGDHDWTAAIINLICYVGAALVLHDLGTRLAGAGPALLASALFAIWPSHIMGGGLANSEMPTLLLWLTILWAIVRGKSGEWRWIVIAGLSTGAGILIRPALLLVPLMLAALALSRRTPRGPIITRAVLTCILAALVVAPWTARNYAVLNTFVVVSTNGGDNLYRANNPKATGGFTQLGEQSFNDLLPDEIAWNRASAEAAHEWILGHPLAFLRLSFRKLGVMLGSDDTGAYWALQRAHNLAGPAYEAARWVSNVWWFVVWTLAALAMIRRRQFLTSTATGQSLLWSIFYFIFLHSVFESQPRYHMPSVGPLLILAALAFASRLGLASVDTSPRR